MKNIISVVFLTLAILCVPSARAVPNETYLFQWDVGTGQTFPNWTWNDDIGYGVGAFILGTDPILNITGETFSNGAGPRMQNKTDYGGDNTGLIDTTVVSPGSDPTGGSFHVKASETVGDGRSTWWMWYDGRGLGSRGVTNANTDRMSFYMKMTGTGQLPATGGTINTSNFEVGTYLCWPGVGTPYGSGDGCPYEGPGNRHYYHWVTVSPDVWVHVLLDQHPQHIRGGSSAPPNNPASGVGKNYFENMNQFYMQQSEENVTATQFWVDEVKYYSTADDVEPNQNDLSVTSLWVAYKPATDDWEIGFNDGQKSSYKTYEIKWATAPITNANWASANSIIPLINGGVAATGDVNLARRPNTFLTQFYTRFKIDDAVEAANSKMYFAVKDVSVIGQHTGSAYPFNAADDSNTPSSLVKTIDYFTGVAAQAQAMYTVPAPAQGWAFVRKGGGEYCWRNSNCQLDAGQVYFQRQLTSTGKIESWVSCPTSAGCTVFQTKAAALANLP